MPSAFTVVVRFCTLPPASVTTSVIVAPSGKSVVPLKIGVESLPLATGSKLITGGVVSTVPLLSTAAF